IVGQRIEPGAADIALMLVHKQCRADLDHEAPRSVQARKLGFAQRGHHTASTRSSASFAALASAARRLRTCLWRARRTSVTPVPATPDNAMICAPGDSFLAARARAADFFLIAAASRASILFRPMISGLSSRP